jgi:hypothetical protein
MGADGLTDAGAAARFLASEFDCTPGDRLVGNVTLEKPALRPHCTPVVAQRLQQLGREHDVSILLPLALIHTDYHPLAVDIGELQANGLRDAQAGSIAGGQNRSVFSAADALEKVKDFLWTENDGQFLGFLGCRDDLIEGPPPLERDFVEKA